jgi:hypothetical protein
MKIKSKRVKKKKKKKKTMNSVLPLGSKIEQPLVNPHFPTLPLEQIKDKKESLSKMYMQEEEDRIKQLLYIDYKSKMF